MRISAPNDDHIVAFNENFDTYVAFMQAFRQVWDAFISGLPASVGEANLNFMNHSGGGGMAPQNNASPNPAKFAHFSGEIAKLMNHAANQGWIRPY